MLTTVDFNYETSLETDEIENVPVERRLLSEMEPLRFEIAERIPLLSLGWRQPLPKSPSQFVGHNAYLLTPPLAPPRQGERNPSARVATFVYSL